MTSEKIYLNQNVEKFAKPFFIRKNANLQFSDSFPQKEVDDFLNEYFANFLKNDKPDLDEKLKNYKTHLEWLTVSNAKLNIDHIYVTCKIQLTVQAQLEANYAIFIPLDLTKTESAIEIFANSNATFRNCHFVNALRTAVIVRNYSTAIFENCTFEGNRISAFVMEGSYAKFVNCKFTNDNNISIFATKNSECEIDNCEFLNIIGKATFGKDSSNIKIYNSYFNNCQKGVSTIAENSQLWIAFTKIESCKNTAIREINNSVINAICINIIDTEGNAINIENSTGYFIDSTISNTIHPTIAVLGHKSNPIFYNCNFIKNMDTFVVISKNGSRPLFDYCFFTNCTSNCFSISDFSRPHIQNCSFKDIDKYFVNIFGGSTLTFFNNFVLNKNVNFEDKINVSCSANIEEKILVQVMQEDDEENDEEEDLEEHQENIKPWISPNYKIPEKMEKLEIPDVIESEELKYLKIPKIKSLAKKAENMKTSLKCVNCQKQKDLSIMVPCGHLVCNECKNIDQCPICSSPIKNVKNIFVEDECSICLDHSCNTISLPCGHLCMCYKCAILNSFKNFNCPLCNEPITGFKFIFDEKF